MIEPSRLAAYIASRICHDLISPVATVNSALEMMQDAGDADMKAQTEQLLHSSASHATARLQFLRYAFGSAGLSTSSADRHEMRKVIEEYMGSQKPSLEWEIDSPHFSYSHARVLMNIVLLAIKSVPRGGVVSLKSFNDGDALTIVANAKGPKLMMHEAVGAAIDGGAPEGGWSADTIQPYFANLVIGELGGVLSANKTEEAVTFMARNLRSTG
jgi:histidine phosphotransferase ChpT